MAQKDKLIEEKMKHSGVFVFSDVYGYIHGWLKDKGYGIIEDEYNEDVSDKGRDISSKWTAIKDISDYFKSELKLKIAAKKLTNIKAEVDGVKQDMNKGDLEVEIVGNIVGDPESKWDTSPFLRFMRDFYNKYIIPSRVGDTKGIVRGHVSSLKEDLKSFLDLYGKR